MQRLILEQSSKYNVLKWFSLQHLVLKFQLRKQRLTFLEMPPSGLTSCCRILRQGSLMVSIITGCFICIPIKNNLITERKIYIKYIK